MSEENSQYNSRRPVKMLNAEVARKIAAGEVIDRPNAIVRELMDNAVDSGAKNIAVEITGGGIEKIRIVDDGCGMTKDDLSSCARPHATSKITTETDLLHLSTLGFRGEALSSMAAVSRLEITSGGWKMNASVTEDHLLTPAANTKGTIVQTAGLFENFPARRLFLKRPASEAALCKNMFIEKSLPRSDISFSFSVDGDEKINLPANQTSTQRFCQALNISEPEDLFYEVGAGEKDWSFKVIIGEPSVTRDTRKDIYIYVNGRRIQEYSLMQAIEYGGQGYFPNGLHPVACLFVTIDSSLVDFNIHPAKREARFKDIAPLHHAVSTTVRNFFKQYTVKNILHENDAAPVNASFDFANNKENYVESSVSYNDVKRGDWRSRFFNSDKSNVSDYQSEVSENDDVLSKKQLFINQNEGFHENLRTSVSQNDGNLRTLVSENDGNLRTSVSQNDNIHKNSRTLVNENSANNGQFTADKRPLVSNNDDSQNHERPLVSTGSTPQDNIQTLVSQTIEDGEESNININEENSSYNKNRLSHQYDINNKSFKFIGSALGTFLIAEKNDTLYIIDQHAAHERIRFNEIMAHGGEKQALLIPYTLETSSGSDDNYLESIKEKLTEAGFTVKNCGNGKWEFYSVPVRWKGTETDLFHDLLDKRISPDEVINSIAATTACKGAVKDGTVLDDITASKIAEEALMLPDPHCPHGRPIYTAITREQLFALVKRT
ncbi:MAG: DNA mismatch repair endonuclease MutL [Treponema sp.]